MSQLVQCSNVSNYQICHTYLCIYVHIRCTYTCTCSQHSVTIFTSYKLQGMEQPTDCHFTPKTTIRHILLKHVITSDSQHGKCTGGLLTLCDPF